VSGAPAAVAAGAAGGECPLCAGDLREEQAWCLRCGAAARTRLAASPNWRVPVIALASAGVLALGVLAASLVKLAEEPPAPIATTQTVTEPPTTTTPGIPGSTTPGTTTPGTTTPGGTSTFGRTTPGGAVIPPRTTPGGAVRPGTVNPRSTLTGPATVSPGAIRPGSAPGGSSPALERLRRLGLPGLKRRGGG
jgi:hypothetical protein